VKAIGKAAGRGDTTKRSMLAKSGLDISSTNHEAQVLNYSLLPLQVMRVQGAGRYRGCEVWLFQLREVTGLQAIGCGQKNRALDLEDEAFFGRNGLTYQCLPG
jgi:hypothetical protein